MNIKQMTLAALAAATGAAFAGSSVRGATFVDAGNRLQVLWDDHVVGAKVVTKQLVFTGSRMFVNFTTSARGRLFATLRDASGQSIKSIELFGDKVDREVDFPSNCNVAEFAGKPTVVEFDMFDADLYSFRFR